MDLPVYKYSAINVVHFYMDKQKIESNLSSTDGSIIIKRDLTPRRFIDNMPGGDLPECKVDIRYTFRVWDEEKKDSFGSYISEQSFHIKYVNDAYTHSQIKHLFSNSHFMSLQEFERLRNRSSLPEIIKFPYWTWSDLFVEELFQILKAKFQHS